MSEFNDKVYAASTKLVEKEREDGTKWDYIRISMTRKDVMDMKIALEMSQNDWINLNVNTAQDGSLYSVVSHYEEGHEYKENKNINKIYIGATLQCTKADEATGEVLFEYKSIQLKEKDLELIEKYMTPGKPNDEGVITDWISLQVNKARDGKGFYTTLNTWAYKKYLEEHNGEAPVPNMPEPTSTYKEEQDAIGPDDLPF